MVSPAPGLRCRQIEDADIDAVAALLARGFPAHDGRFWLGAFAQLTRHEAPPGLPKYGYLLESGGVVVGAILLICSTIPAGDEAATRCNLSSWYVDPAFRTYAPMLVSQALRHKDVTYLNVSPAPHTRPIIEAQGFSRYCDGIFIGVPMLNGLFGGPKAEVFEAKRQPNVPFDLRDREMLVAARGAWLPQPVVRHARARLPFRLPPAFGARRHPLRAADLLQRHGRFHPFRRPGRTHVGAARSAIRHCRCQRAGTGTARLVQPRQHAEIFQGAAAPRLGDLAYTEHAVMGV